jgi:RNA polymerase sigma factor (sigma-70 family)
LSLFATSRDLLVIAMWDDLELLRKYAAEGSDDAFRTILERHIGLVYSAALRQVRDPHLAEEVTQAVFVVLARKAGSLSSGTMLVGWLFRTTRFVAARAVRDRQLRQLREQEAAHMEHCLSAPANDVAWEDVAPALDDAMARLGETDRHAVLLRFFEKKELKEVGRALGSSEDAAKKRVSRALDKLRTFLVRRGIMLSSATLAGALLENSVHAAPTALSASTFATVTAKAGAATTIALVQGAIEAMFYAKLKAGALAATLLLAVVGGGFGMTSLFKPKQKAQVRTAKFITFPLEKFDGILFASYAPGSSDWTLVPIGNLNFGGVPFHLTTKLQLQGNSDSKDGRYYPSRVMGIPVHERLARLHLLHTANIPGTEGRPVAALRFNYAGGKTHTLFVVYGVHTRDWWKYPAVERISAVTDTNTSIAWTGRADPDPYKADHRFFQTVFELPDSPQPVETIDAFSLFDDSSFIILAMTGEPPGPVRRSYAAPSADDSQFRTALQLKVTDGAGNVATGAMVRGLAINDQERGFYLGKMDDTFGQPGVIPVDFPANTRELRLVVMASGRGVTEITLQVPPGQSFPRELVARLEPGISLGGIVRDLEDHPIENARVELFRSSRNSKGKLLVNRFVETKSDAQGKWRIPEVPPSLNGLFMRVTHSDFKSNGVEFVSESIGESGSGLMTRDALVASQAEFKLTPAPKKTSPKKAANTAKPTQEQQK